METLGTPSEGDWSSLSGVYLYQDADFKAHFKPYEDSIFSVQPTLGPSHKSAVNLPETEERAFCSFDAIYHNSHWSSNVNIDDCIAISFFPNSGYNNYFENLDMESQFISTEICDTDAGNSSYLIDANNSPQPVITGCDESHGDLKDTQLHRGSDDSGETAAAQSKRSTLSAMSRKRRQNTDNGNVRNVRRKNQKPDLPGKNDGESHALTRGEGGAGMLESHALTRGEGGAGMLEVDANSPQEPSGNLPNISSTESEALNLMGKTRATRGSATDPQSLYARKRRERINERLRILQKLVPNGTKVDISTMLEEAVHYVKFLQLQIRMLSSDELWMYAPISYNGMNIGFDWQTFKSR